MDGYSHYLNLVSAPVVNSSISAALVDLDDTLITSSQGSRQAMQAVVRKVCCKLSDQYQKELYTAWSRTRSIFWTDERNARIGSLDPRMARSTTLAQAMEHTGIDRAKIDTLLDLYEEIKGINTTLVVGAVEVLTKLRTSGISLGLVTNGTSQEQRAKIKRFQLSPLFDAIVVEEETGIGKPDPYPLTYAIRTLNANDDSVIMIGDDYVCDGRAAESADIRFLHIGATDSCEYCAAGHRATHLLSLLHVPDYVRALPG